MVEKLIEDMRKAFSDAVASGFCQGSYQSDFEKFDTPVIRAEADKQINWVWVITPCGTALSMYGMNAKSNEFASAILHTGYTSVLVFRVEGFTLKPWDVNSADAVVSRRERYSVSGSTVMCDKQRLATFEANLVGQYDKRCHEFHFRTESKSVGKIDLIGLRNIAIQEAVRREHTLLAKVSHITVNGVQWDVLMDEIGFNSMPSTSTLGQQALMLA